MAGMNLRTGFTVGGTYTPLTPASAQPSTSAGNSTIAAKAYGISGTGSVTDNKVPGYGTVAVGIVSLAFLVYLWWTLPE